jgi:hypothetical protein
LRVGFNDVVSPFLQRPFRLNRPVVPVHVLADTARQPPVLVVIGQGTEIGFVAKAGVGKNHPALPEVVPIQQVGADAIALLLPDLGRNTLPRLQQTTAQVSFGFVVLFSHGWSLVNHKSIAQEFSEKDIGCTANQGTTPTPSHNHHDFRNFWFNDRLKNKAVDSGQESCETASTGAEPRRATPTPTGTKPEQ